MNPMSFKKGKEKVCDLIIHKLTTEDFFLQIINSIMWIVKIYNLIIQ